MVAQTKAMAVEVNGEKWWDFGYILKLELTRYPDLNTHVLIHYMFLMFLKGAISLVFSN